MLFGKILNIPLGGRLSAGNLKTDKNILSPISDHMGKHKKPDNDNELGYYLAGLIEGDGYFGDKRLEIIFHESDASLAYNIKKWIGYGNIYKVKDKKALKYSLRHSIGLKKVLELVNGKFITENKILQLKKHKYDSIFDLEILSSNPHKLLDNHWLAGFADADGCFCITIVKSQTYISGFSIRLEFKIKQKDPTALKLIKEELGGNLNYFKKPEIYCYNTTSFKRAFNIIRYFDNYHLNSSKYLQFIKWRKAYRIIQAKEHLTEKGFNKIVNLKKTLRDEE